MAITSVGYDGTVDESQWASMVSKVGGYEYGIDKAGDFAITQSAGTRMVSISAGLAWGRGVMDISDAPVILQLDSVSTGSRYDLIALRRTWGPANGGPTEIVVVKGTSAKTIPSGRQSNPGVVDDQPLALVRVTAGVASIPEIIDLRIWGRNGGQLYARNDLVRIYLSSPGTEINVNGIEWRLIVDANSTALWEKSGPVSDTGWNRTSDFTHWWGGSDSYIIYRVRNGVCQIRVGFDRLGDPLDVPASGNITNVKVGAVPNIARPSDNYAVLSSGDTGALASAVVRSNGDIQLVAVSPGDRIYTGRKFTLGGTYLTDL